MSVSTDEKSAHEMVSKKVEASLQVLMFEA